MIVGGKEPGRWVSDRELILIRENAYKEASRYNAALVAKNQSLEQELASQIAECRRYEEELEQVRGALKIAEALIPEEPRG